MQACRGGEKAGRAQAVDAGCPSCSHTSIRQEAQLVGALGHVQQQVRATAGGGLGSLSSHAAASAWRLRARLAPAALPQLRSARLCSVRCSSPVAWALYALELLEVAVQLSNLICWDKNLVPGEDLRMTEDRVWCLVLHWQPLWAVLARVRTPTGRTLPPTARCSRSRTASSSSGASVSRPARYPHATPSSSWHAARTSRLGRPSSCTQEWWQGRGTW